MRLGWTCFRPDLVGTETWDDGNTVNGDGEETLQEESILIFLSEKLSIGIVRWFEEPLVDSFNESISTGHK